MNKKTFLIGPMILSTVFVTMAAAQAPKSLGEIPIYPGAALVEGKGADYPKYEVRKAPEDLVKFYVKRLQAREEPGVYGGHDQLETPKAFDVARDRLRPGETTPVFFSVGFWPQELYEYYVKEGLPNRPAYRPNQWIQVAGFHWAYRDGRGDVKWFTLEFEDTSPSTLLVGPRGQQTVFTISSIEWKGTAEEEEVPPVEEEEPLEEEPAAKPPVKPPIEKELGMPIYPGSRFDTQLSTGLSQEREKYYVYFTNDPISKVVQFYEAKTGKKAMSAQGGSFWVILQGEIPWPKLGVLIEPAAGKFGAGSAKTVFTIRKELGQKPE